MNSDEAARITELEAERDDARAIASYLFGVAAVRYAELDPEQQRLFKLADEQLTAWFRDTPASLLVEDLDHAQARITELEEENERLRGQVNAMMNAALNFDVRTVLALGRHALAPPSQEQQ